MSGPRPSAVAAVPLYAYGATLATDTYGGLRIQVYASRGSLQLLVIDMRPDDPSRPRGLRGFRPSRHRTPQFELTGQLDTDSRLAELWLKTHRVPVLAAEAPTP